MKRNDFKFLTIVLSIIMGMSILHSSPIRIMPLGDSLTYDWVFEDADNPRPIGVRKAYRSYLSYSLQNAGVAFDFVGSQNSGQDITPSFDTNNEGHIGWDSYAIALETYDYLVANPADIVLVHVGSNDLSENVDGMGTLLDQIDAFERDFNMPVRVILALIIDFRDPYPVIASFNYNLNMLALDRISKGDNIIIVDMFTEAGLTRDNYIDRIHPNNIGYQKMASMWLNPILTNRNDALYLYPIKLVNRGYILDANINEVDDTVTFTTKIPNSGIIF